MDEAKLEEVVNQLLANEFSTGNWLQPFNYNFDMRSYVFYLFGKDHPIDELNGDVEDLVSDFLYEGLNSIEAAHNQIYFKIANSTNAIKLLKYFNINTSLEIEDIISGIKDEIERAMESEEDIGISELFTYTYKY